MKGAHFGDIHYTNGPNLGEVDRCFGFGIDHAIAANVKFAVMAGDSTDHALDVHAPAVTMLARNVRRLADCCPVLMLQGTFLHEPPGTLNIFRLLGGKYPVHVADRISQVALLASGQWLESEGWCFSEIPAGTAALFTCLPTVNKAVIGAVVGAENAAEAVGEQIAILLRGFRPINERARAAGIPTIGVSHGTVSGCVSEHGVPMAGFDHEYTAATLFSAGCSAFMLSHIHMHQSWEADGRWIAYSGSIARLHYGEIGDKGFLEWDVGADGAQFDLIKTPTKRTIELDFPALPDMDALRERAAQPDIEGAFVRVTWSVPEEDRHRVDRAALQALFSKAADLKLEGRVIPVVRARAAGISLAPAMADKVKAWASVTEANADPLLQCLTDLQASSPEAIVERILQTPADQIAAEAVPEVEVEAAAGGDEDGEPVAPAAPVPQASLDLFGPGESVPLF